MQTEGRRSQGSLDDPATRLYGKADLSRTGPDDLNRHERAFADPFAPVAAIGVNLLDERELAAQSPHQRSRPVTVLKAGGADAQGQQSLVRVHQRVALAPDDLLRTVIAPRSAALARSGGLTVAALTYGSMIAAEGEASRPHRSRSNMTSRCPSRSNGPASRNRLNQSYTVLRGGKCCCGAESAWATSATGSPSAECRGWR